MKILSTLQAATSEMKLMRVRNGTILTPYFGTGTPVLLCVGGRVLAPDDPYFNRFANAEEDVEDTTEHYAGILESTDEELNAVREAGYPIYDLREVSLAQFLLDGDE